MSSDQSDNLPNVESTESEQNEKPKKKINRIHVAVAVFAALMVIIGFSFKVSESDDGMTSEKDASVEKAPTQEQLNDSVLEDLINGSANSSGNTETSRSTSDNSVTTQSNGKTEQSYNAGSQPATSSVDIESVIRQVLREELTGTAKDTNNQLKRLTRKFEAIQGQQSKLIRALNVINEKVNNFEGDATKKLDSVVTELEQIRGGVNKIGGEVEKDNKAFTLIVWGRETYAGEVSVSVSTIENPRGWKPLSEGDSLSGWTVKEIRSDEVDFINADGETWTEGL